MRNLEAPTFDNLIAENELRQYGSRTMWWRHREAGRLPYYRIGRKIYYSREQIAEFLEECKRGGERKRKHRQKVDHLTNNYS